MSGNRVEEIANAVLYEGYMLYPYRTSSVKNRQRWNFGVLYPNHYSLAQNGIDPCASQTECLVVGNLDSKLSVKVRFLQAIARTIGEPVSPLSELPVDMEAHFHPVRTLRVGERLLQTWQEATERQVVIAPYALGDLVVAPLVQSFVQPREREFDPVRDEQGRIAGLIVRAQEALAGEAEIAAVPCGEGVYKITLRVSNVTAIKDPEQAERDQAHLRSLLSAHSILSIEQGEFVSLLDPPDRLQKFASTCNNVGTWPVLAGDEGQRNTMLSSPIILYDYPQIAPESPGALFDGTEIDEILALRILTLTDEEKREMSQGDARAREILERTESLPAEQFVKLHGTLRGPRPESGEHR